MAAIQDLINSLYGNNQLTQGYRGTVNQGYQSLDQPLNDPNTGREDLTTNYISQLADVYADRVFKQTGQLPSADQIRQFVSQNANSGNAAKFIQGNLNRDQIATIADQHLGGNPVVQPQITAPTQNQIGAGTNRALDESNKIYDMVQNQAVESNRRAFAPLRTRAAEEEAALGRLRSPVSAAPESAVNNIDVQEGNSLSGIISNIMGQKASNTLDFSKFNETLGAGERRAGEAESQFARNLATNRNQFAQTLNFNREKQDTENTLNRKQLSIADMIGRAQGKNQPGRGQAALSGGLSGAASGAAFGPWGALIGGAAGAGLGYASKDFK